jgi:hypothetical protein
MTPFNVDTFDINLYNQILDKGLSKGLGKRDSNMCIEAVICTVLGLDHGDDPQCVAKSVRAFKMGLNDSHWSNEIARAKGLRDLGLAQLGSLGIIDDVEFSVRLSTETIRVLLPDLIRLVMPHLEMLAVECEKFPTKESALKVKDAAYTAYTANAAVNAAAYAADAAANAAYAAYAAYAAANAVVYAAANAAYAAKNMDYYLILSANLALKILKDLKSPGCKLLTA